MSKHGVVGRYRRVYPRIWRHPAFQKLTPAQRNIALYVLTGPQQNRIGLAHFSPATAAEDLMLGPDTFRTGLRDVCLTFGWVFDGEARVLYVPSWWRWNRPENEAVLIGNLKDLSELPPSALAEAFAQNLADIPPDYRETFAETCRTRLGRRPAVQEQEQEQEQEQDQEQERSRSALAPARSARSRKKTGSENNPKPVSNGLSKSGVPAHLVALARLTLNLTGPNTPIDELTDVFLDQDRRSHGGTSSKDAAIAALTVALSERRSA